MIWANTGEAKCCKERTALRTALAEMLVEFVASHKAGHITTMPKTVQRIVRQAESALGQDEQEG